MIEEIQERRIEFIRRFQQCPDVIILTLADFDRLRSEKSAVAYLCATDKGQTVLGMNIILSDAYPQFKLAFTG